MLSSMYKNVDLVFVGTGNWTVYAYCGGEFFFRGWGSMVSGRCIAKGRFSSLGGLCGRFGYF